MERRTFLASLGAFAAASPARAQEAQAWGAPVIDMHFHMRRTQELNIAHQQGAGVTAANLLARTDSASAVGPLQAGNPAMFPAGSAQPMSPSLTPSSF